MTGSFIPRRYAQQSHASAGFTLVEISIVLVIIGLLAGGVLIGRSLIHASELNKTVKLISSLDVATSAFTDKYNYIPGDMPAIIATRYGIFNTTGRLSDGNGILNSYGGGVYQAEANLWLNDLGASGFISQTFPNATWATPTSVIRGSDLDSALIVTPLRKAYIYSFGSLGKDYYMFGGVNAIGTDSIFDTIYGVTAADAYAIDKKIDDGYPLTGDTLAKGAGWGTDLPPAATGGGATVNTCVNTTPTPNLYNSANTSDINCNLRIRWGQQN